MSSTTTSSPAAPIIKSPCDDNPSADGSVIQLLDSAGVEIPGYSYTVHCNVWFPVSVGSNQAEVIKKVAVADLEGCLQACHDYNQVFDPATEQICYSVGIIKSPGESCYLKGIPNPFGNIPMESPHDSAIWNAD